MSAAMPTQKPADHVDGEGDEADIDAGGAGRLAIAADRVDVAAEARVAEHDPGHDGDERQDEDRDRYAEERALADDAVIGLQVVDRVDPVPDDEAAEGGERAERHDQRIDARRRR